MKKPAAASDAVSRQITQKIEALGDWRGDTLARVRAVIRGADPDVVEELKWMGTPVWSHGGILCTGETYKQVVKLTFAKGAFLADPATLFNASLDGNQRRAIDIREGEAIDERALADLIRAAVAHNLRGTRVARPARRAAPAKKTRAGAGSQSRGTSRSRTAARSRATSR